MLLESNHSSTRVFETSGVPPLHQPNRTSLFFALVDLRGIEPLIPACKAGVLPLALQTRINACGYRQRKLPKTVAQDFHPISSLFHLVFSFVLSHLLNYPHLSRLPNRHFCPCAGSAGVRLLSVAIISSLSVIWPPTKDSNPHCLIRSQVSCPIRRMGEMGAKAGFEPAISNL